MSTEFKREARYTVFKGSDLAKLSEEGKRQIFLLLMRAGQIMEDAGLPMRKCLVIEQDWPEYEPAWASIEARTTGTVPNVPDCAAAPPVGHDDAIREALRAFVGAAYPVASQINERGHNWSEAYLDEALALARAALERKPSSLVAQLQADLTARDEQIDALRQGMKGDYDLDAWLAFVEEAPQLRMDAGRYRWLRSRDLEAISQGGVFAGLTPDNLVLNEETLDQAIDAAMAPDYVEASTHGRLNGIPKEPCSGCGTPGWTGACNKCIPY